MTTAGPNACGTGSNYNDGGSTAWGLPTRIQTDDTLFSGANIPGQSSTSQMLKAKNFGFSIPSNSVITDVSFDYKRKSGTAGFILENKIEMLDASGNESGTNKNAAGAWAATEETITKHGDSTYWGLTLTPELVNNADFGLEIKALNQNSGITAIYAYVQFVSCTVTYTLVYLGLVGDGLVQTDEMSSSILIG